MVGAVEHNKGMHDNELVGTRHDNNQPYMNSQKPTTCSADNSTHTDNIDKQSQYDNMTLVMS